MQKLGWGHFSTVWLARDFKYGTYVAIKVQKSASHYLDAAYDEVELLQKAAKMSTSKEWRDRLQQIYGVIHFYKERLKAPIYPRRLPRRSAAKRIHIPRTVWQSFLHGIRDSWRKSLGDHQEVQLQGGS